MFLFRLRRKKKKRKKRKKRRREKKRKKKERRREKEGKREIFFLLNAWPCTKDSLARGGVAVGDDGCYQFCDAVFEF